MEIIKNPLKADLTDHLDNFEAYSANKKASSGLTWAIVAAVLVIIGALVPDVSIVFVLVVCGISMYYINGAKKEGSTQVQKIKWARGIVVGVIVVLVIAFAGNALNLIINGI